MSFNSFRTSASFALLAALLALAGCHTLDTKATHWPWCDRPCKAPIGQVVALWGDGLVVQPDALRGGSPTPGFAGKLYLFGHDLGEPLGAEGSLVVYLYDLQQPAENRSPREVWNISCANLERIAKKDALGWGYDIWLPWSTYHKDITRVGLVIEYKPVQGIPVWSTPSELAFGQPNRRPGEVVTKSYRQDPRQNTQFEGEKTQSELIHRTSR